MVITGRTNVGKTWIGEYFATVAWNMGYKILFYSGEMSREMVGFRFDTLNKHFSNMGLLNGAGTLGKKPDTDGGKYLEEDYENYINQLSQKSGFIVVTPDDFEGRKPNADELKSLALKHKADMIVEDFKMVEFMELLNSLNLNEKEQIAVNVLMSGGKKGDVAKALKCTPATANYYFKSIKKKFVFAGVAV